MKRSFIISLSKIILSIIQSATKRKCELLEMDLLQAHFQDSLGFLIVLDDLWNEDREAGWRGGAGSKVLVIIRSTKVAGTTCPYSLQGLTEDACWVLFKQRAEVEHPNLLEIGKQIINKCGGVPLAESVIA